MIYFKLVGCKIQAAAKKVSPLPLVRTRPNIQQRNRRLCIRFDVDTDEGNVSAIDRLHKL